MTGSDTKEITPMKVTHIRMMAALGLGAAVLLPAAASAQPEGEDANHVEEWETWLAEDGITATCYKHDPGDDTPHGTVTEDGLAVVLGEFDPEWPGDRYVLLVVKGGDGNAVVVDPLSGAKYTAPLNGGDQTPAVSHWIVCKGEGETPPTTTVVPTTTSLPVTTTSMNDFIDVPSTTVPSLPPVTATSVPVVVASSTQVLAEPAELAFTGARSTALTMLGFALVAFGSAIAYAARAVRKATR